MAAAHQIIKGGITVNYLVVTSREIPILKNIYDDETLDASQLGGQGEY